MGHRVHKVFSLVTTALSDSREEAKVLFFDEFGYLSKDRSSLATNIFGASADISWYKSGVLEHELNFENIPESNISCKGCEIANRSAQSMNFEMYKELVEKHK